MEITRSFKRHQVHVLPHDHIPKGLTHAGLGLWLKIYLGIENEVSEEDPAYKELCALEIIVGNELTECKGEKKRPKLSDQERLQISLYGVKQAKAIKECTEIGELNKPQKEILSMWLKYRKKRGQYATIVELVRDIKRSNLIDITAAMTQAMKAGSQGYFIKTSPQERHSHDTLSINR